MSRAAHTAITQNYYANNTTDGGVGNKSKVLSQNFIVLLKCASKSSVIDEGFHNGIVEKSVVGDEGHDKIG